MPASTPPAAIASTTANGWIDTARPITSGCKTCASSCCTAMIRPKVISAKIQPLAISATITARPPAITAPTSGMNAPRNTSDASGSASGMPMIARPVPMPTASTSATRNVART